MRFSHFSLRKPILLPVRLLSHTWVHGMNHHIFTRASALTYTALLAIVPTMILIHSIAGAFGILDLAEDILPLLNDHLQLGLPVAQLVPILGNAETIGFGQLGVIGSVALFITFILAMENLETNINVVWNVKENRSYLHKVVVAIPFLVIVGAMIGGITGFLSYLQHWMLLLNADGIDILKTEYWQWLGSWGIFIGAHLVLWLILYLTYQLVPYTRVHPRNAVLSALFAVVVMRLLIWAFLHLQSYFFHRMSLFYGSLAFIPLVMLFIYGLWCVVLFGNTLSWRMQHWPPRKGSRALKDHL